MPLIQEPLSTGKFVRFSPKGTSMLTMLRQGSDCVVLSLISDKLKKYDLPLYQQENGKYVLHRIIRVRDTYTCIGENQFQKKTGIRQNHRLALVTGFYQGKNHHSVTKNPPTGFVAVYGIAASLCAA